MTTQTTTTELTVEEKRNALKVFNTDRLIRIERTQSVSEYMDWLDSLSAKRINKEYFETFVEKFEVDPGC